MEPVDSPDLMAWARKLEAAHGTARATTVIDFAKLCMTEVGSRLGSAAAAFATGRTPSVGAATREPAALTALAAAATDNDAASLRRAMRAIDAIPGRVLHRRELWTEMDRALARSEAEPGKALVEHAWRVRDVGRQRGRRVDARSVSRTLLIKGLEFDHALVLDADSLDTNNLYVAITRGSSSLTVLSAGSVIQPTAAVARTGHRRPRRTRTSPG
jgi:DNA helicase-2/ATP-dependent DNA helicase PcrA